MAGDTALDQQVDEAEAAADRALVKAREAAAAVRAPGPHAEERHAREQLREAWAAYRQAQKAAERLRDERDVYHRGAMSLRPAP